MIKTCQFHLRDSQLQNDFSINIIAKNRRILLYTAFNSIKKNYMKKYLTWLLLLTTCENTRFLKVAYCIHSMRKYELFTSQELYRKFHNRMQSTIRPKTSYVQTRIFLSFFSQTAQRQFVIRSLIWDQTWLSIEDGALLKGN